MDAVVCDPAGINDALWRGLSAAGYQIHHTHSWWRLWEMVSRIKPTLVVTVWRRLINFPLNPKTASRKLLDSLWPQSWGAEPLLVVLAEAHDGLPILDSEQKLTSLDPTFAESLLCDEVSTIACHPIKWDGEDANQLEAAFDCGGGNLIFFKPDHGYDLGRVLRGGIQGYVNNLWYVDKQRAFAEYFPKYLDAAIRETGRRAMELALDSGWLDQPPSLEDGETFQRRRARLAISLTKGLKCLYEVKIQHEQGAGR